jgi:hypothetical protein
MGRVHRPSTLSLPAVSPNWHFVATGLSCPVLSLLRSNVDARYRLGVSRLRPGQYRP